MTGVTLPRIFPGYRLGGPSSSGTGAHTRSLSSLRAEVLSTSSACVYRVFCSLSDNEVSEDTFSHSHFTINKMTEN